MNDFQIDLSRLAYQRAAEIEQIKESYIKAVLDEKGWKPSECVLIVRNTFDGYEIGVRKLREGEDLYGA